MKQEMTVDELIECKLKYTKRVLDTCKRKLELLNKLNRAGVELTPEEKKVFSLSFYSPAKRKYNAAVAAVDFWSDSARVKAWMAEVQQKPKVERTAAPYVQELIPE